MSDDAEHWHTQRVCLSKGAHIVHLLPVYAAPERMEPALCGQLPALFNGWLCPTSPDERDRAAALAVCLNCERVKRGRMP